MTTGIIGAQPSAVGIRIDAVAAVLKWPLQAWHQWREQRRGAADIAAMSDAQLKDLGLERDSHHVAIARGRAYVERIYPF
ncbi:MAG: DUF1127 domain-containing protein [Hyphomicrobiaceae bacterium]